MRTELYPGDGLTAVFRIMPRFKVRAITRVLEWMDTHAYARSLTSSRIACVSCACVLLLSPLPIVFVRALPKLM